MKIGGQGSFTFPIHCVQADRFLIVSDKEKHCMKVHDRNGNFQYKFVKQGGGDGEFNNPCCLSVNKSGQLMVCDSGIMIEYKYLNWTESLLASLKQKAAI